MTDKEIISIVYKNTGVAKSPDMDNAIKSLIDEAISDLTVQTNYDLLMTSTSLATVSGQDWQELPGDFLKESPPWKDGRKLKRLTPFEYWEERAAQSQQDEPVHYSIFGKSIAGIRLIHFEPVPDAIYTYTLPYYSSPKSVTLAEFPTELHILIPLYIIPFLLPERDSSNIPVKAIAQQRYDKKLKELVGVERREGDVGMKIAPDPAFRLKQPYILRQPRGRGNFNFPWD